MGLMDLTTVGDAFKNYGVLVNTVECYNMPGLSVNFPFVFLDSRIAFTLLFIFISFLFASLPYHLKRLKLRLGSCSAHNEASWDTSLPLWVQGRS